MNCFIPLYYLVKLRLSFRPPFDIKFDSSPRILFMVKTRCNVKILLTKIFILASMAYLLKLSSRKSASSILARSRKTVRIFPPKNTMFVSRKSLLRCLSLICLPQWKTAFLSLILIRVMTGNILRRCSIMKRSLSKTQNARSRQALNLACAIHSFSCFALLTFSIF